MSEIELNNLLFRAKIESYTGDKDMKSIIDRIELIQADITTLEVDAIVNASKKSLKNGDGVNGAIHKAAGVGLDIECESLGGCETGEAKITGAYKLPCKKIVHTVGPRYNEHSEDENEKLLTDSYINSLLIARENKMETLAFPSISTGIFGYPFADACETALRAITGFLVRDKKIKKVLLVCYSDRDYNEYAEIFIRFKQSFKSHQYKLGGKNEKV